MDIGCITNSVYCTGFRDDTSSCIISFDIYVSILIVWQVFHLFRKVADVYSILPTSFCEASITLIPKPNKKITRRLQTNIYYEYGHKNPKQNTS